MKFLSRRIGKLEARIRPQERPENERLRELLQRRCRRLGVRYEEPSPESRRSLTKMTLTEVLRAHFGELPVATDNTY